MPFPMTFHHTNPSNSLYSVNESSLKPWGKEMRPMSEGISKEDFKKISQQIEQQLQKQIYESLSRFLNEDVIPQQSSPQSASQTNNSQPASTTATQNQQAGQIENVFHGIANMIANALNFGMSTLGQQKKMYLQQLQQQLKAQLDAQNAGNDPSNDGSWGKPDCAGNRRNEGEKKAIAAKTGIDDCKKRISTKPWQKTSPSSKTPTVWSLSSYKSRSKSSPILAISAIATTQTINNKNRLIGHRQQNNFSKT